MSELNPNHPVTRAVSDQWHKIAALLVNKSGGHVVTSASDFSDLGLDKAIVVWELPDGLHLTIIDNQQAALMACQHEGLPS